MRLFSSSPSRPRTPPGTGDTESVTRTPRPPRASRPRRFVVSVRVRLLAVIAAAALVGLVGVGAAVYLVERHRNVAATQELLRSNLDAAQQLVQAYVSERPQATSEDALRVIVQRVSPDDNMGLLGIVDGRAAMVPGFDLDLEPASRPDFVDHVIRTAPTDRSVIDVYEQGGPAWMYAVAPISVAGAPAQQALFVMAYDLDAEMSEIDPPARAYVAASAVMIVLIIVVGAFAAGRLLRPLRRMRETAERVSGRERDERIPVEGRDDVSELARTMNDMLDRIDASLDAQRQLLSDVRHELRTPITIVRGHLELMDPLDPDDVRQTQELAVDELDRMNALVQDLSETS